MTGMKKGKVSDNSISGIALVLRIDAFCKIRGITRKSFCETLGILQGTMATWKTKNIFPPVETLVLLSERMNVSLDWLITGKESPAHSFLESENNTMQHFDSVLADLELLKAKVLLARKSLEYANAENKNL